MKKNMGIVDRFVRILLAVSIAFLVFLEALSGSLALFAGMLAIIFLLTAFVGICPLYMPFGFHSDKRI